MRFLNSVTVPKNVKGGTLLKQMKGGPFGAIQKVSKKVAKK